MTERNERSKLRSVVSLIISLLFHIIIFSVIYLNLTDEMEYKDNTIYLDFDEYEKKNDLKKDEEKEAIESQTKPPPQYQPPKNIVEENSTENENFVVTNDSLKITSSPDSNNTIIDYDALVDSFLANNKNLIALKLILRDRMKNETPKKETNLDLAFKQIRKQLYEIFKDNYPVDPKHYNPSNPGGISIPLDKILDLFK